MSAGRAAPRNPARSQPEPLRGNAKTGKSAVTQVVDDVCRMLVQLLTALATPPPPVPARATEVAVPLYRAQP